MRVRCRIVQSRDSVHCNELWPTRSAIFIQCVFPTIVYPSGFARFRGKLSYCMIENPRRADHWLFGSRCCIVMNSDGCSTLDHRRKSAMHALILILAPARASDLAIRGFCRRHARLLSAKMRNIQNYRC